MYIIPFEKMAEVRTGVWQLRGRIRGTYAKMREF
jgi:hypothetical protein